MDFLLKQIKLQLKILNLRDFWKHNLKVKIEFITKIISTTYQKINIPKKIGLLSLDIDGVDYWVLKNYQF